MGRDNFHSRQVVLDASLRLQLVRARHCDEWTAGRGTADVHVFGTDVESLREWIQAQLRTCEELIAVTTTRGQTLEAFLAAHRYNRSLVELSVRTVRYEVARLMEALDVGTRFAAGVRYARAKAVLEDAVAGTCNRFAPRTASRQR